MSDLGQPVEDVARPDPDDLRMWSVTTILGVLNIPALLYWAAGKTATAAIDDQPVWRAMLERDRYEAWKWLRDARFRDGGRLSDTARGSVVHACCEQYALTGVRPSPQEISLKVRHEGGPNFPAEGVVAETAGIAPYLDQFDAWLQAFAPEYQATEVVVYHPTYGYAGTCDGFIIIDGQRLIIDYKSTERSWDNYGAPTSPYPESALQTSAYRFAKLAAVWRPRRTEIYRRRYYLLSETERAAAVPVPEVDGGIVIHITPEHCHAHPVRCDETVFEKFLFVQEVARWQFEMSRDVIGAPMVPPASEWPRLAAG